MIAWSIEIAKASGLFDHVIVSTDDREIAEVANDFGAEVPFYRPAELSDDYATTVPVIAHAISECKRLGLASDYACCIYPCAPFIQLDDLKSAFSMLIDNHAEYVYPVTEYAHPIQRAMSRDEKGGVRFIEPESELVRTQDLARAFHDTGQFYWGKSSAWLEMKKMHSAGLGLVIPHWRVVDVDTVEDWHRAELLFRIMQSEVGGEFGK